METPIRITVLAGGVGGGKFLKGLRLIPDTKLTLIVNNGDDLTIRGLRVCPDLDSIIYNLGGISDPIRGWGRAGETWSFQSELAKYLGEDPWFNLGDKDMATHIFRTMRLSEGMPLHEIVAEQCRVWGINEKILPVTNDFVETQVQLVEAFEGKTQMHFQEWWVRHRAKLAANDFVLSGCESAVPAPGVMEAINKADIILFAPSNPIVSIGMILRIPGVRTALKESKAPVVGISPIIGGNPILGMADKCLSGLGLETSASSVAAIYGARTSGGLLDGWLVAESDETEIETIRSLGIACVGIPLLMSDDEATRLMAQRAIEMALDRRAN